MMFRVYVLIALIFAFIILAVSRVPQTTSAQSASVVTAKGPVVVELFTSEGCSSCPPADALLRRLETQSPTKGAEVIVLGWHVDYWDRLGWKDRFSSAGFTRRQQQYADAFASDQVYTPQMVVDGRTEFVGSDEGKARAAINNSAKEPKAQVSLSSLATGPREFSIAVDVAALPPGIHSANVTLVVSERGLVSDVKAGENSGRTLQHAAVVRMQKPIGIASAGSHFRAKTTVSVPRDWRPEQLNAAILLENSDSQSIVGAASIPLR